MLQPLYRVIFLEVFWVAFSILWAQKVMYNYDRSDVVVQEITIEKITGKELAAVYIHPTEDTRTFLAVGWVRAMISQKSLLGVEAGDKIVISFFEKPPILELFNRFLGKVKFVGLRKGNECILSPQAVLVEAKNNFHRAVFLYVLLGGVPTMAVLWGWILTLQLFLNPRRYERLREHFLVEYRLKKRPSLQE